LWPGNSSNILKLRWPEAKLIGLDDSEAMIQQAKEKYKDIKWVLADATGDLSSLGTFDIYFQMLLSSGCQIILPL
jgi:trans-aconitate 2-methyltransferase